MTDTPDVPHTTVEGCDLCEAAQFTHWYHADDICWVADCEVCSVPMVVWRSHGTEPSEHEWEHMIERLRAAGTERFGNDGFAVDTVMRQIPEHWHAHARDDRWFELRGTRPLSRFTEIGGERVER